MTVLNRIVSEGSIHDVGRGAAVLGGTGSAIVGNWRVCGWRIMGMT